MDPELSVRQGDVFWVDFGQAAGSSPAFQRPAVIIQNDRVNRTRINTVVVCTLSTNVRLGAVPGNVTLAAGEGGIPRPSVVVVSQIATIDRGQLDDYLGHLPARRIREIVAGVWQYLAP